MYAIQGVFAFLVFLNIFRNCVGLPGPCTYKNDAGPCMGYFPKFYYDMELSTCKKFIYGGCGGNANRFETIEQCKSTCT
ncbi:Kunitz-type serine protease inhibitor textilinin-4 [Exaiptasia diaphana]|nr:Kunitz-type serine protease inhibitor textilinin-4 [Exaiptasia diaphana]